MKEPRYRMTEHVCRSCGVGRILEQTNSGPTGGGNTVYKCATCGEGSAAIGPSAFCYCGWKHYSGATRCWPSGVTIPTDWHQFKKVNELLVICRAINLVGPSCEVRG